MPPKLSKPAALAVNITKAVLDVLPREKLTNKQQDDLDAMTDSVIVRSAAFSSCVAMAGTSSNA